MEQSRWTLPPLSQPGQVITFYSYDGAPSLRHCLVLAGAMLSDRAPWPAPVLLVDWDVHAPTLTRLLGADEQRPGLLELMGECAQALAERGRPPRPGMEGMYGMDGEAGKGAHGAPATETEASAAFERLARDVLDQIDWSRYIQRADPSRPLFVLGAGRLDATFGERAHTLDWDGLFHACPALFRELAAYLARRFAHVLVAAPGGRSAPVSLVTALFTDRLVGLFHPDPASLEGLCGTVQRAIDYRCSHEDEQRPLLFYPVPLNGAPAGLDVASGRAAMQARLEQLMSYCYGIRSLSLSAWLRELSLPAAVTASAAELLAAAPAQQADHASLPRQMATLLDWVEPARFPWQSPDEVSALRALDDAVEFTTRQPGLFANALLARAQAQLGSLYLRAGRRLWAHQYLADSLALRESLFGPDSAETLDSVARLADWTRVFGQAGDMPGLTERLLAGQRRQWGTEHPCALGAWLQHVQALAGAGDVPQASAALEELLRIAAPVLGPHHAVLLDALETQGQLQQAQGEGDTARARLEQVLATREQVLGPAHAATLALRQRLRQGGPAGTEPAVQSGEADRAARELAQAGAQGEGEMAERGKAVLRERRGGRRSAGALSVQEAPHGRYGGRVERRHLGPADRLLDGQPGPYSLLARDVAGAPLWPGLLPAGAGADPHGLRAYGPAKTIGRLEQAGSLEAGGPVQASAAHGAGSVDRELERFVEQFNGRPRATDQKRVPEAAPERRVRPRARQALAGRPAAGEGGSAEPEPVVARDDRGKAARTGPALAASGHAVPGDAAGATGFCGQAPGSGEAMPEGGLRLVGFEHRLSGGQGPIPGRLLPVDGQDAGMQDSTGLAQRIERLRHLIDLCALEEARAVADGLRHEVLHGRRSDPLRDEAVQLMRQVYLKDNDQQALLELCEDPGTGGGWTALGGRRSAD
jgi:tetratricopeptide (TPR) repeat protein